MEERRAHSIGVRFFVMLLSYSFLLFLLNTIIQYFALLYRMFTDPFAIMELFFLSMLGAILYRFYALDPEKYELHEMINFMRASMMFGNYFRLRDADTRERIGTHRMKTTYEEVHGKPFNNELLATAFDEQVTTFKKIPVDALKEKSRVVPPGYHEQAEQLKKKQRTDVSDAFRFQLLKGTTHALMKRMERFEIDPVTRVLAVEIDFPVEQIVPVNMPAERSRLTEFVYEAVQHLIAEEWFLLYAPFISVISVTCRQKAFDDTMTERVRAIMTFKMSLHQLHRRGHRITTAAELKDIAEVRYVDTDL